MLKPGQNLAVVMWLGANSTRPTKAIRLWAMLLEHLHSDTGQIMLSHDQIAEEIGVTSEYVSETMGDLVKLKVIFTEHQHLKGVQGPRRAVYFMNKHVAEVGSGATEKELKLIPKPSFAPQVTKGVP